MGISDDAGDIPDVQGTLFAAPILYGIFEEIILSFDDILAELHVIAIHEGKNRPAVEVYLATPSLSEGEPTIPAA